MEFFFEQVNWFLPHFRTVFLAIVSLGFLIFIHELGHFYAAKQCGIKVNTFSIGFGPKIVGIQRGETEYKISMLPFGGYVQMEGENPSEQTGAPGEFASASIGNRAFVVAAGPIINLLFGVLAYSLVFATGFDRDDTRLIGALTGMPLTQEDTNEDTNEDTKEAAVQIGWVADNGPGAAGGLMPGDILVSINGESIRHWATFDIGVRASPNRDIELVVERDGTHQTLTVKPEAVPGGIRGDNGRVRASMGYETVVSKVRGGSIAAQAGIQEDDLIVSINGKNFYGVPDFSYKVWHISADWVAEKYKALYKQINENRDALTLGIYRGDEQLTLEIPVEWRVIASVQKGSLAKAAGIRNGDVLLKLNGAPIDGTTLYTQLRTMANQPIEIDLMRDGTPKTITLASETESSETETEGVMFGLMWRTTLSGMQLAPKMAPLPEYGILAAFGKGLEASWLTCTAIGRTLQKLIRGEVSPKQLAGPIGITTLTGNIFNNLGLSSFIFFVGFISINLGIVNLLPIPIADGGHLLFFAVEKIRGKPMPRRAQEIVQQVSVVFLIAFFLYLTWFDGMSLIYD